MEDGLQENKLKAGKPKTRAIPRNWGMSLDSKAIQKVILRTEPWALEKPLGLGMAQKQDNPQCQVRGGANSLAHYENSLCGGTDTGSGVRETHDLTFTNCASVT